jgi:diketogulonate reductase-like aldo/keto reductase
MKRIGTHRHVRGVLDTSTVLLLARVEDAGSLPAEPLITAVTLAELSVGPLVASDHAERENLGAFHFELNDVHMERLDGLNEQWSAVGPALQYL